MDGVHDGLRVVTIGSSRAGDLAAMFFADHGAEVVKVEPSGGDPLRADPGWRAGTGASARS
jgi:crotonobetainyl-CoA:carnitine CoA-transferase CaiB-like acyl-CoA transferase